MNTETRPSGTKGPIIRGDVTRSITVVYETQPAKGKSMRETLEILERVAPSDLTVIITGEQGTGKEWAARLIHQLSARSSRPFHVVDCSALPEDQVEKELFGFESLSWNGIELKRSAFEEAAGGTLFLQDLDSTPDAVQLKVARAIEYGQYRRIGGEQLHTLGARLIVGMHDGPAAGRSKGVHHDTFASRSTSITIALPPLRKRKQEIPRLIEKLVEELGARYGHKAQAVSPEAVDICCAYDWPGNIRQLKNAIEYASVMCRNGIIRPEHLPDYVRETRGRGHGAGLPGRDGSTPGDRL
jgi:DNA-binding NtrC family response regulator